MVSLLPKTVEQREASKVYSFQNNAGLPIFEPVIGVDWVKAPVGLGFP